ncbi:MAG: protein-glutamate O-methyltransferase [Rhodomicrobium sp.]|jgi:chemotaxis protein methyltransferase CheR
MEPASQQLPVSNEFPFTAADFRTIVGIVYERSGIVLAAHKRDMTYSRLARRVRALGLRTFRDYCALLEGNDGGKEVGFLINAITTNLTKFFREHHHFEHLRDHILTSPPEAPRGQRPRIRIWSAGCSSGEEPYSIAMTAMANQRERGGDWDLRILATDLDTSMLKKAKTGIYPRSCLESVPPGMRERFFTAEPRDRESVSITQSAQELITFRQLNLLSSWPMSGKFDAIFCRNVMIYFDAKTKATLIDRFHGQLADGGWLYVGHSESLLDHQSRFKLRGRTIYQKISS